MNRKLFSALLSFLLVLMVGAAAATAQEPEQNDPIAPDEGNANVELENEISIQNTIGTAFNFQGRLSDGTNPANGTYDFEFRLYDAPSGGSQAGGVVTKNEVTVTGGLFSTDLDFGSVFNGTALWLETAVRPGNSTGAYTQLSPRQALSPVPFAHHAAQAGTVESGMSGDGFTIKRDDNFFGFNMDALVIEKTDGNQSNPDGGIAFMNKGNDGISENSLVIRGNGDVGIGIDNPSHKLTVDVGTMQSNDGIHLIGDASATRDLRMRVEYDDANNKSHYLFNDGSDAHTFKVESRNALAFNTGGPNERIRITELGKVGIGTRNPGAQLHVSTDPRLDGILVRGDGEISADWFVTPPPPSPHADGVRVESVTGHGIHILEAGDDGIRVSSPGGYAGNFDGTVKVDVLEIVGGSDLSEQFDVRGDTADFKPTPGMVVSIDPEIPGELTLSNKAYDRQVAGIISGAGGINPGMLMGQADTKADGQYPVALTGRVYVQADASHGAIQPGDLLTSSDIPGHAMKVTDHDRAQGAILGKAMSSLDEGQGLVLVLVSLQ